MIAIHNNPILEKSSFSIGLLVVEQVQNNAQNRLSTAKRMLENELREKYGQLARSELKLLHPMDVYVTFYKQFGYTYHVLPQLESVAKGKALPEGLPLVEAMYMAELKNMLLTAGHDLDKVRCPLRALYSEGQAHFTALNGKTVSTLPGDIMITDQASVISSILRGPDLRTAITEQTSRVIYTVYAPNGINKQLIRQHLDDIESYVQIFSGESVTYLKQVFEGPSDLSTACL